MITWKQPLPGYEWLIHQIWYLEVPPEETLDSQPKLIPNPRAHIILSPSAQPYHYIGDKEQYVGYGCHLLTTSEQLLTLEEQIPLKRIGITLKPDALYLLTKGASIETNQITWFPWLDDILTTDFINGLLTSSCPQEIVDAVSTVFSKLDLSTYQDHAYRLSHKATSLVEKTTNPIEIDELANHGAGLVSKRQTD